MKDVLRNGMKDFDYFMEWTASEGRVFDLESYADDDMESPSDEEIEELEKALREKGFIIK